MKLFNKILDEQNIFNSIFCMESYVFDKGLLDTSNPVYLHDEGEVKGIRSEEHTSELQSRE